MNFTQQKTLSLEVDFSIQPETLLKESGYTPENWKYLGTLPKKEKKKVTLIIGTFDTEFSEEDIQTWLKGQKQYQGSGAWVLQAYKGLYPNGDGEWLLFPDPQTSRWRLRGSGGVDFPGFWDGGGVRLGGVWSQWGASGRVGLLLCESGTETLGSSEIGKEVDPLGSLPLSLQERQVIALEKIAEALAPKKKSKKQ
jgi:hypothetical protein